MLRCRDGAHALLRIFTKEFNAACPGKKLSHKLDNNSTVLPRIEDYGGIRISSYAIIMVQKLRDEVAQETRNVKDEDAPAEP